MKNLDFEQMEIVSGGGKNRNCMIVGAITVVAAFTLNLGAVCVLVAGATYYGCFD